MLEQLRLTPTAPAKRIERWRTAAGERVLTLGQLAAGGLDREVAVNHAGPDLQLCPSTAHPATNC